MLTISQRALLPLDVARGAVLRVLARQPWLRPWVADRERRIAVLASLGIVSAFVLTLFAPAAVYAVSPIVFGVPHVASDVRYLVVRQGLSRGAIAAAIGVCAALLGCRLLEMYVPESGVANGAELAIAAVAAIGLSWLAVRAGGSVVRATLWSIAVGGLAIVAVLHATTARLVLAHGHNVVAVAIWIVLFRKRATALWLPLGLLAITSGLILSGATFATVVHFGGHDRIGTNLIDVADWLAPGLGAFGVSLTLSYVFLQSIHYAVWLGWIPQEETRGQGSLTFHQSWRSLVADFGWAGITFVVASMVTLAVLACLSLQRTRDLYLYLAGFHAYLEIAMLGYLLVRRTKDESER